MHPMNPTSSSLSSATSSLTSITTTKPSSTASTSVTHTVGANKQLTSPRHYHTKTNQAESEHRRILNNLIKCVSSVIINSTATETVSSKNQESQALSISASTSHNSKTDSNTFRAIQTQNDLLRIHECIEQIFLNGLRVYKPDVSFNYRFRFFFLNYSNQLTKLQRKQNPKRKS